MTARNYFSTVDKILMSQAIVLLLVATCLYVVNGETYAIPSLIGGLTAFIPNLYFAIRISLSKGKAAKKIMHSFYAGESGKILITAGLFFLIFQIPDLNIIVLMASYLAVLSVYWFALLIWREC